LIAEISKNLFAKTPAILSCDWWHQVSGS
jgi:hypothetical protein